MLMTKIRTLVDRLPPVRGEYVENFNLGRIIWFKVGGPAEIVFTPADLADLRHFLTETPRDIPVTVIGAGSNLLVRDGGVSVGHSRRYWRRAADERRGVWNRNQRCADPRPGR